MTSIESLLQEAQQKLVGSGTRSRLIHVNRQAKRGNLLNIINERSDDVYQIMRVKGRQMKFAGKGEEEDEAEADGIVLSEIRDEEFDESRYTDLILETPLTPDALQKRLLRLSKDSRTAEEEQGINILFLALGFLQWYEDEKSEVLRESPLILLPVALVRNARTSTFDLVCRDDDIVANMSLQERMQRDFGVLLPQIDDAKDWAPSEYFAEVAEAIGRKDRWALDPDGMQLGFFSFAKLVMFHDLDPENWDGKASLVNTLISGLLGGGFESTPPLFKDDDNLDAVLPPAQILQVVDADASQTKVIEEVRAGSNLVVQGPPGTGKSQTITNILAAAVHDGKKVLFVAEKMAALEVVHNRMCKVGLQDLCLELHSRRANRRAFLQALAETIFRSKGARLSEADTSELRQSRDELNRIDNLLHSPLPERDYTPFEALSALILFISRHGPVARVDASQLEAAVHSAAESRLFGRLDDYVQIVQKHGPGHKNPFAGATNLELQPTDLQTLAADLQAATALLDEWIKAQSTLEAQLTPEPELTLASAQSCNAVYRKLQNPPGEFAQFIGLACKHRASPRFADAIACGSDWTSHKKQMSGLVTDSIWNYDLDSLRAPMARGAGSWFARVFGRYGSASKELGTYLRQALPKSPAGRLQLLDQVIEGKIKKRLFDEESEYLKGALGEDWRGERTPFAGILEVVNWLGALPQELREFSAERLKGLVAHEVTVQFDPPAFDARREALLSAIQRVEERLGLDALAAEQIQTLPLPDLRHRMDEMSRNTDKYDVWTQYQFARAALLEFPVGQFLALVDRGEVALDDARAELEYVLNNARWEYARKALPELNKLARLDRHALAASFARLEKDRVQETQRLIRQKHLSQVPQGSVGEMGLIRGEIAKQRNHRPIRQMMRRAAGMIQRIKPVFLMSPISVAQFLPPGEVEFDLLVIDEASQVRPEDALGSVARAKQIVVVGDQKQLPPTSFFERLTANTEPAEEEDDDEAMIGVRATEMESVLSLCEARGLNERMLEWHYRSKDPSLITVSNVEFYQNRLILPPCPTESDQASGLRLVRAPGVYVSRAAGPGKGRPGTNRIEAEAVAGRLQEIALSRPDCSVGIVTFSKAQADMMTEVLELRRRQDETLNRFLAENKFENVFVKNIENVQGDERDIILISVGYGPHKPNGPLASMNFGPINSEGGERRLNVLFTRSRIACEVFTSFDPSDINPARTSRKGTAVLRKFLKYAHSRELPEIYLSQGEADSPFEEDVADAIRKMGYEADHQVGTAGFKIDLGVRDRANPQRHILAVECDGATYHSALWARERDRLRQEILEGFGWHFHRIWSTDWFYRRASEVQKLRQALEEAQVRAQSSPLKGANSQSGSQSDSQEDAESSSEKAKPIVLEEPKIELPKYRKADIVATGREPHERPLPEVVYIVCEIVKVEGPVHRDEIARRYASAHGKARVGSLISGRASAGLAQAAQEARLVSKGEFWGTEQQFTEVPVRDRSEESGPTASAESISPDEIRACAQLIKQDSGAVEEDELIRALAKTFGFKRAGPEFQSVVRAALWTE